VTAICKGLPKPQLSINKVDNIVQKPFSLSQVLIDEREGAKLIRYFEETGFYEPKWAYIKSGVAINTALGIAIMIYS
jgi:hypothetical protein